MIFEKYKYLPYIIFGCSVIAILYTLVYLNVTKLIKKYWISKLNLSSRISLVLYIVALVTLSLAILDPRGAEEKVESNISDQKTILLIDSSLSMLVEDVRPNRFERALFLARHFIKNASGHQISVVLFSDLQKKIIPFTSDIQFLDAKLAGMNNSHVSHGASNLKQALAESTRYFVEGGNKSNLRGNIIIFSDFEEHESFSVSIPESISVAAVGIGTTQGGPIPIRNKEGIFKGNKKFENVEVISKLDEENLKALSRIIPTFKRWIALSYTVPSEEIIEFFREQYITSLKKGLVSTRPTLAKPILTIGFLILLTAILLRFFPAFSPLILLVSLSTEANVVELQNYSFMNKRERFQLAEKFMTEGKSTEAYTIYKENYVRDATLGDKLNYLTAKLSTPNAAQAFNELKKLYDDKNTPDNIKEIIRKNILAQSEEKDDKEDKNKDKQNSDENKESKKDKKENKGKGDKSKDEKDKKGDEKWNEDKQDDKNADKKETEAKQAKENVRDQLKKHESEQEKERKTVKIPAFLKQLTDDDADLQKKYTDTATDEKGDIDEKKNW